MQTVATIDYKALYEQSMLEVLYLKQQLSQLQKMIFGSKQERFVPAEINPAQLSLAIQAETVAACSVTEAKKISYTKTGKCRTKTVTTPRQVKAAGKPAQGRNHY